MVSSKNSSSYDSGYSYRSGASRQIYDLYSHASIHRSGPSHGNVNIVSYAARSTSTSGYRMPESISPHSSRYFSTKIPGGEHYLPPKSTFGTLILVYAQGGANRWSMTSTVMTRSYYVPPDYYTESERPSSSNVSRGARDGSYAYLRPVVVDETNRFYKMSQENPLFDYGRSDYIDKNVPINASPPRLPSYYNDGESSSADTRTRYPLLVNGSDNSYASTHSKATRYKGSALAPSVGSFKEYSIPAGSAYTENSYYMLGHAQPGSSGPGIPQLSLQEKNGNVVKWMDALPETM